MRLPSIGPPSQAGWAKSGVGVSGRRLRGLVSGEARFQLAAQQQRNGKLGAGAAIVGIERQRPAEAADRLVEPAEIAQAEGEIVEAFGVVAVERDRLEVMLHRLVEPVGGAQRIAEIGLQRRIVGIGGQRQAMMRHRGVELADQPQRHAEIVVQLGVIGLHRQQPQIGGDRLVEPAGAMGLRREPQLLHEAVDLVAEQRRRLGRGLRAEGMDRRGVVHALNLTSNQGVKHLYSEPKCSP